MRIVTIICFAVFLLCPVMAITFSTGPPSDRTGAPGELTCQVGCHSSFGLNSGAGSLSIGTEEEYRPGDTLDVQVSFNATGRNTHGFEITVQDAGGSYVGELLVADATNTRFTLEDTQHITHNATGNQLSAWTVQWVAPAEDAGPVTFYAAGVAANGNNTNQGDYVYTTSLEVAPGTAVDTEPLPAHTHFTLDANFPNPFQSQTAIRYRLERATMITLSVYDVAGRLVRELERGVQPAGEYSQTFEAEGLPAGLYLVTLRTPEAVATRKMLLAQ